MIPLPFVFLIALSLFVSCASPAAEGDPAEAVPDRPYLEAARAAAIWIATTAVETTEGAA